MKKFNVKQFIEGKCHKIVILPNGSFGGEDEYGIIRGENHYIRWNFINSKWNKIVEEMEAK
jgi:hypothetical protein